MVLRSLVCIFTSDSKALVAYSSVSHISFLLLILIGLNRRLKRSGVLLMLAHGYISSLIFFLVSLCYRVCGTRLVYMINSLWACSLFFGLTFLLIFMANVGSPFTLAFYSEVVGVTSLLGTGGLLWLLRFYYFVTFYYSVVFAVVSVVGKNFFSLG